MLSTHTICLRVIHNAWHFVYVLRFVFKVVRGAAVLRCTLMSLALKLGFQQEARLRKVRYYDGEYYDSVKYGLLRSEWSERN
ncbi:hypothetical protein GCM10007938_25700 [Vibrio zhanjiangensis]|uniref:N-acetyltransferase domain-containing protein n=1 Tax=Vibrio zhanjiangensis TaxID=1046128 RepID=A0ABQ6F0L1_9VIBR|nr:hypothetical protein GCM10007938_25700 [Vibrio zhanjiangensis]